MNLIKWLLVWNKISPPSVEYIVARLINPKISKDRKQKVINHETPKIWDKYNASLKIPKLRFDSIGLLNQSRKFVLESKNNK